MASARFHKLFSCGLVALNLAFMAGFFHWVLAPEAAVEEAFYAEAFAPEPEAAPVALHAGSGDHRDAFFAGLLPYVIEANRVVLAERMRLEVLEASWHAGGPLSLEDLAWVRELAGRYGFEGREVDASLWRDLSVRVDVIPPSLALAQAALESNWGRSRFARLGNNLYGIWCYRPGCGIVPKRRPAGRTYEVAHYDSPQACFQAYMHNLNTNQAYLGLRLIRKSLRESDSPIAGHALARGLEKYSQERQVYIRKVQRVIEANALTGLDASPDRAIAWSR